MSKLSFLKSYGLNFSRKSSIKSPTIKQNSNAINKSKTFKPNMQEMKQVFDKYDRNKDGKVSIEEYKRMLKAISGREMITEGEAIRSFQVSDKDGDGFIDFMEFMELHNNKIKSKDIENAFRVFDSDGDGKLSATELMEVHRRLGETYSLESCRKMITDADTDGDGLINMDEFTSMMTRTMHLAIN